MKDTMEAEMRFLFDWAAKKSHLCRNLSAIPDLRWDDDNERLLARTEDAMLLFRVEVIRGRTRREIATIELRLDEGGKATEEMHIPADISEAALALREGKATETGTCA